MTFSDLDHKDFSCGDTQQLHFISAGPEIMSSRLGHWMTVWEGDHTKLFPSFTLSQDGETKSYSSPYPALLLIMARFSSKS